MMTREQQIEAMARAEAKFDGREWQAMPRWNRERYVERVRVALEAADEGLTPITR